MKLLLLSLLALSFLCRNVSGGEFCCGSFPICCRDDSDRCDGYDDCLSGCDEDGCLNVVGIAVGVSIAGFFLLIVLPIAICVIIWCCVAGAAANAGRSHTTYVTHTPAAQPAATVVTSNQQTSAGSYYPAPQGYQPPGNPPQYSPY